MNNMTRKKDQILGKLKAFIRISRDYMEFLKNDSDITLENGSQNKSRGMARAFLFDSMLKSLMLIVDDVIG